MERRILRQRMNDGSPPVRAIRAQHEIYRIRREASVDQQRGDDILVDAGRREDPPDDDRGEDAECGA